MAEKEKEVKAEHKNVYAALAAFQGELKPIEQSAQVDYKTKAGERVNFKYTPLGKIMETIYPLLAKHGLSVRWELGERMVKAGTIETGKKYVECFLTHESLEEKLDAEVEREITAATGEREVIKTKSLRRTNELSSGKLDISAGGDMKDTGAQITYARRYTIGLVLGLSTEEDKDVQLMEESRENVEGFAFKQAKKALETSKGAELDKQVQFLKSELYVAEILEKGEMPEGGVEVEDLNGAKVKRRVPALGLKAEQYRALLEAAAEKKAGGKTTVVPENGGA